MSHVLQPSYTYMFRDEALPSLNASVSIFSVGLSVSILKNIYQIKMLQIMIYSLSEMWNKELSNDLNPLSYAGPVL